MYIVGKLQAGVSFERVLHDIRNTATDKNFERLHYVEKKDLHNILRDFKIGYHILRHHEDDTISLDILIQKLGYNKDDNSAILHYVNNGEEFSLIIQTEFQKTMLIEHSSKICVDGTHGMCSKRPNIQLFTLLIIDEFGNGLPVAFYLSNKADTPAMKFFFEKVKEAAGQNISSDIFMSDDDPVFYEAWKEVMGPVQHRLLCWWHINKNWTKNINIKIKNPAAKELVNKTLHSLATCTEDVAVFEGRLLNFVKTLACDSETIEFYQYFNTYYVKRAPEWAFCYRKNIGLNTNMALENMHRKIKHIYFEGKQCTRLDKATQMLLLLVRDVMFDRIIKIAKRKPTDKIKRIQRSHTRSKDINDDDVEPIESDNLAKYSVKSQSAPDLK